MSRFGRVLLLLLGPLAVAGSLGVGQAAYGEEGPARWIPRSRIGQDEGLEALASRPDGKALVSGGDKVRLWNVRSGTEQTVFFGHPHSVNAVAFSPDGKTLASACASDHVRLWDVRTEKPRGLGPL